MKTTIVLSWAIMLQVIAHDMALAKEFSETRPYIDAADFPAVIPIDVWSSKIFLTAEVNGSAHQFILDSGSPSMLTSEAAQTLGLEIVGRNKGQDANGNVVETELAIVDRVLLGGLTIRNVPVYIFDSNSLELGHCLFDGGIIGSEIMALANWQIDLRAKRLVVTDDLNDLEHIEAAKTAPMKVFGYPFYPIVEHGVNGEFTDNALFDTGSSEVVHLNQRAYEHLRDEKIIGKTRTTAVGTFGTSAGGRGSDSTFYKVNLDSLVIGNLTLRDVEAWTRPQVPTLIGAGIFKSHIVTLDYADSKVYFSAYEQAESPPHRHGFRPYFRDGNVYVGFIERKSDAEKAGLRLHDQIVAVDNRPLSNLDGAAQCDAMRWLQSVTEKDALTVRVNGADGERTLQLDRPH